MKPARWDRDEASEADCVIVNVEFTESAIFLSSYASVQKAHASVWHTVAIRLSCADCDVSKESSGFRLSYSSSQS